MNNYDWLISKLDAFIRKYYANQVLRGTLVLLISLLCFFLITSIGEYFLYMPSWLRLSIAVFFVVAASFSLVIWIVIPLLKMLRLRSGLSYEQAAKIIGTHFPQISDQLLNMLQLKKNENDPTVSRDLIAASIDQKASKIVLIPLTKAVDLRENRKYLRYMLPLILIGIIIFMVAPGVFTDASQRLLQPTREFERPAPFQFHIVSEPLQTPRGKDYTLQVKLTGEAIPQTMGILIQGQTIDMSPSGTHSFSFTFRNVTESVRFRLSAAKFYSKEYTLQVVNTPILSRVKMLLQYPKHTGKKDEQMLSLGDMAVPQGTKVTWELTTAYTDKASVEFDVSHIIPMEASAGKYQASASIMQDTSYQIVLTNKSSGIQEKLPYRIQAIEDQYPTLQLEEHRDTLTGKKVVLLGVAGDDYGISRLNFHYSIADPQHKSIKTEVIPLVFTPGVIANFTHYFDIDALSLEQGQKLSYYVEAWDNDEVNGPKSVRSEVMSYFMYTKEELDSAMQMNASKISSGLSQGEKQVKNLSREIQDIQRKLLQQDKPSWEQQESMKDMVAQHQQLQQLMEEARKRFEEQMQQSKQKPYSEDILEKQEALKEQLDNLIDKELKEQLKKLEELMAKMNRDNAVNQLKQMEQENKLFQMDLKRVQELMNRLEMQMRMEDMAGKMEELANKQLDLKEKTESGKEDFEKLSQEQADLKDELDKAMKEDFKEMNELNDKLSQPQSLEDIANKAQDAQEQMKGSEEDLNKQHSQQAGKKQQKAAENLQQMAAALQKAAGGMSMEQIEMDIKAVRQILTNLIRLSFDQESLMTKVQQTSMSSPVYLENQASQNHLHRNSRMIRDSLYALSKRLFKLGPTINKETALMEQHLQAAVKALEDRQVHVAAARQQYVMTSANNLALLLNETLSNLMQMQSESQSQQEGMCNNPGGNKPKPGPGQQLSDIITRQKDLGDAYQQMKDAKQKRQSGQQPGEQEGNNAQRDGQKEGGNENGGSDGNAEMLARLAREQAMIRRQLQELQSLLNSKGYKNHAGALKEIQENMDRMETDIVNRRLTAELLLRQKNILSRLLETEKAIREQEEDDKRSATSGKELSRPVPPELQKFIRQKQQLTELYKTVPAQLKPYYKSMAENYYSIMNSGKK